MNTPIKDQDDDNRKDNPIINNTNNNNIYNHYNVNNIKNNNEFDLNNNNNIENTPQKQFIDDESYDGESDQNITHSCTSIHSNSFNSGSSNNGSVSGSDNNNTSLFNIFKNEKNKKNEEEDDEDIESEFGKHEYELETPEIVDYSESIVSILIPVSITMIITIILLRTVTETGTVGESGVEKSHTYSLDGGVDGESDENPSTQGLVFNPIINSIIFLAVIILSTFIMVVLYKFKFMKALYGWLIGTSILLLGVFGGYLFILILIYCNVSLDYITFVFIIWNFSAGGMVCIYYYSPRIFHRAYLVSIAVLMALFLTRLPEWTTWAILAIVSIYDIFAVLCPGGPLKQLIDTARKRGEEIPALIYNASVYIGMADLESNNNSHNNNESPISDEVLSKSISTTSSFNDDECNGGKKSILSSPSSSDIDSAITDDNRSNYDTTIHVSDDDENDPKSEQSTTAPKKKQGIKLGLGDFVFYSVLIGRAAMNDMITVCTCFVAIITGLFLTLFLLALLKRALPALPMSIGLGILFYFITKIILTPYLIFLGTHQVFI